MASYYVATTGNNGNPGTEASPWQTPNYAVTHIVGGDTIYVRAGTYTITTISSMPNGSASVYTVLRGYPNERPILQTAGHAARSFDFTGDVHHLEFRGLEIKDVYEGILTQPNGTLIPHHFRIVDNKIHDTQTQGLRFYGDAAGNGGDHYIGFNEFYNIGIYTPGYIPGMNTIYSTSHRALVENNYLHNVRQGIGIYSSSTWGINDCILRNNVFYQLGRDDLDPWQVGSNVGGCAGAANNGANHLFYNNIIYESKGVGFSFNGGQTNNRVFHNTFYNLTVGYAVDIAPGVTGQVRNNIFRNTNTVNNGSGAGVTVSNNMTTDPLFVNPGAGNFHLQAGSPAINAGFDVSASLTTDYDGGTRTLPYDLGAYEFASAPAPVNPTLPVVDAFTDADGTLLPTHNANWIPIYNNAQIQGNAVRGTAAAVNMCAWNPISPTADMEVYGTIAAKPGPGNWMSLFGRLTSIVAATMDGYVAELQEVSGAANDLMRLYRMTDGAYAQLGIVTQEFAVGDQMFLKITGSSVALYQNGVARLSVVDATYPAAGRLGFDLANVTGRWDAIGGLVATLPATYYVALTGNDAVTCTQAQNPLTPKATIAAGINCMTVATDQLEIDDGVYAETLPQCNVPPGTSWSAFTKIRAKNSGAVTIRPPAGSLFVMSMIFAAKRYIEWNGIDFDGLNVTSHAVIHQGDVTSGFPHHIRYRNCRMRRAQAGTGLLLGDGFDEILTCEIDQNQTGLIVQQAGTLIDGCLVHHSVQRGIALDAAGAPTPVDAIVRNCQISHNGTGGSNGTGLTCNVSHRALIYNNLIYNNIAVDSDGIFVTCTTNNDLELFNNTIYGNGRYGIELCNAFALNTRIINNLLVSNVSGALADSGTGTIALNNFSGDAKFVDAPGENFRLLGNSPAINAGQDVSADGVVTDILGVARPFSVAYDIGAYEFTGTIIPSVPVLGRRAVIRFPFSGGHDGR